MTIVTLGLDLGKNWIHMVGLDAEGRIVLHRRVRRERLLAQTVNLSACLIGMEACCGAHHLGRALEAQGHTVRLMPPQYVKPFVKSNKNDYRDAEATAERICGWIRHELRHRLRRNGAVVGISGGIDSAVIAALCVRAIGPDRVLGVALPEYESEDVSVQLAREFADQFGFELICQEISAGLAGMGDLIATCVSSSSRNHRVGYGLGRGKSLDDIIAEMNMVAEGVKSTRGILDLAAHYQVEMPITEQVGRVLYEGASPADAVATLMSRGARSEHDSYDG